jgi:hypothetical protein
MRALLLLVALALARECTTDDYAAEYTQCRADNKRNLIYYLKEGVVCSGGYQAPPNVFGLSCTISCPAGQYLEMGASTCSQCSPGGFSLGGGIAIQNWSAWPTEVFLTTECRDKNDKLLNPPTCTGWLVDPVRNVINSGNTSHNSNSYLKLDIYLVGPGYIHFGYAVDAELGYDGLRFEVDGGTVLSANSKPISKTIGVATFQLSLDAGLHSMRWRFSKDPSVASGADKAWLTFVRIGGVSYADSFCTPCAAGEYANASGRSECAPCPANTYAPSSGASTCASCSSTTYSIRGEKSCTLRPNCTTSDYEFLYGPCVDGSRLKYPHFLPPVICMSDSYALPDSLTVPCGDCAPGFFRAESGSCEACPSGWWSAKGSTSCTQCPAGTAAVPAYIYTEWNQISPFFTFCTGDCMSDGWRPLGTAGIDSGASNGPKFTSAIGLNLVVPQYKASVRIEYKTVCKEICVFECSNGVSVYRTNNEKNNGAFTLSIDPGNATLSCSFSKNVDAWTTKGRWDRAIITRIIITGAGGGAPACLNCSQGSYAPAGSSSCALCPAGQSSPALASSCTLCANNTHNIKPGGTCRRCMHGMTATPDGVYCSDNGCAYTDTDGYVYNLSPLKVSEEDGAMHGPVTDTLGMSYYLNVCSSKTGQTACLDSRGKPLNTFLCQYTNNGYSVSLGSEMGFYDLPKDQYPSDRGLILSFESGSNGCGNSKKNITAFPRSANVTFICDPTVGKGEFQPPLPEDGNVESSGCRYQFLWRTIYACPLCSEKDWNVRETCQDGVATLEYSWRESPKRCYGGADLPPTSTRNCIDSAVQCAAGSYRVNNECFTCPAGTYSLGGGQRYEGFTGSQPSAPFVSSSWRINDGALTSGDDTNSLMQAQMTYRRSGYMEIEYRMLSFNSNEFSISVNGVRLFNTTSSAFSYTTLRVPIVLSDVPSNGKVLGFNFVFTGGNDPALARLASVAIRRVDFIGTGFSDLQCTPCGSGMFNPSAGESQCQICPGSTYSHSGAVACSNCKPSEYSSPGSETCTRRIACVGSDWQAVYGECVDHQRNKSWVKQQPDVCLESESNTPKADNALYPCRACLPNTFGETCQSCESGKYYDEAAQSCVAVGDGSAATPSTAYWFDGDTLTSLPVGWSTFCTGLGCGSSGWRARGSYIDSGFHYTREVESNLALALTLATPGFVSFTWSITGGSDRDRLRFLINDRPVALKGSSLVQGSQNEIFELNAGTVRLQWTHHQEEGHVSQTKLSDVVVAGFASGPTVARVCPAGYHSANTGTASYCEPCAPGTAQPLAGQSSCNTCEAGTYSSASASLSCSVCGEGTASEAGASGCSVGTFGDCAWQIDNKTVDLSPIGVDSTLFKDTLGRKYELKLCRSGNFSTSQCNKIDSHVCMYQGAVGLDSGSAASTLVVGSSLSLVYKTEIANSLCATPSSITLVFICDTTQGISAPQVVGTAESSPCSVVANWQTRFACPICLETDYLVYSGKCDSGLQKDTYIRLTQCNGPESYIVERVCAEVGLSFTVLYIVGGLFVALAAIAGVTLWRWRKMQMRYSRLEGQMQEMQPTGIDESE